MHDFTFYVGSTATHAAHADDTAVAYLSRQFSGQVTSARVWGVWDGTPEEVAQFVVTDLPDGVALRVAVALSAITGNECVLLTRRATGQDSLSSFQSVARYRAEWAPVLTGNRTLFQPPLIRTADGESYGFALRPDVTGPFVARLAYANGTVSAVTA